MKIAIINNTTWNVKNFRKGFVLSLINQGHEVVAITPEDEHVDAVLKFGCRHVDIKVDSDGVNPFSDIHLLFQYLKILRRERPDIVLAYTVKPNIFGSIAARFLSIPVINNISGLGTAFIRDNFLTKIVVFLYKNALRHSERVFFQNHDDRDLFIAQSVVRESQAMVIPGSGIDTQYYQPISLNRDASNDQFVFLLIARLIWDKGIQEYVDAARVIKADRPNVKFQILGFLDVDNRTAVQRSDVDSWESEGVIEYLGATDDVRSFIGRADCIVLPSYREGLPRTLLEAGAMAKPMITTDVAGCREVVDNAVNGFLCNVRDDEDLASKMNTMLDLTQSELGHMGRKSREKIQKTFDEKNVIDAYLSEIDSIVSVP